MDNKKAIMISIKPKYVAKILNGEKTIEIRKTCPQVFKDLKPYECCSIDVYIYCTKEKETIAINPYGGYATIPNKYKNEYFNGKVVAKFTLNKVEEIKFCNEFNSYYIDRRAKNNVDEITLGIASCLYHKELNDYLKEDNGYAWHISNLVIFDRPKELSGFRNAFKYKRVESVFGNNNIEKDERTGGLRQPVKGGYEYVYPLTKAPQSWCYVEVE